MCFKPSPLKVSLTLMILLSIPLLPWARAQPLAERVTVSGTVRDADTQAPVANASVRLTPAQADEGESSGRREVQAIIEAKEWERMVPSASNIYCPASFPRILGRWTRLGSWKRAT